MSDPSWPLGTDEGAPPSSRRRVVVATVRPRTRGDCEAGPRPCLELNCRQHMLSGPPARRLVRESDDRVVAKLEAMPDTCVLDVVDRHPDGVPLEDVGPLYGVVRERIRQIQVQALAHLRTRAKLANLAHLLDLDPGMHRREPKIQGLDDQAMEAFFDFLGQGGWFPHRALTQWAEAHEAPRVDLCRSLRTMTALGLLVRRGVGSRAVYQLVGAPDERPAPPPPSRLRPEDSAVLMEHLRRRPDRNALGLFCIARGWQTSSLECELAALVAEGLLVVEKRKRRVCYRPADMASTLTLGRGATEGPAGLGPASRPRSAKAARPSRAPRPLRPTPPSPSPSPTQEAPMIRVPHVSTRRPWLADFHAYLDDAWRPAAEVRAWLVQRGMGERRVYTELLALRKERLVATRGATISLHYGRPEGEDGEALPLTVSSRIAVAMSGFDDRTQSMIAELLERARERPDRVALLRQIALTWRAS